MDLTPDIHQIQSEAAKIWPWHHVLGELIDNAFDAGANQISITMKASSLEVTDDGCGMSDVAPLLRRGCHARRKQTALGMYGVGFKDAWTFIAGPHGPLEVATRHRGVETRLSIKSPSDITSDWQGPDPTQAQTDKPDGTTIYFPKMCASRRGPRVDLDDKLSKIFSPALRSGRQILVKRCKGRPVPLTPPDDPELSDVIADTFEVCGNEVAIRIGLLPEGKRSPYTGFALSYRHRVIEETTIGTGKYSASRVAGSITLGDGWMLTRNKDNFVDNREDLADAIFSRIERLLEKAETLSETLESQQLTDKLSGMMNAALSGLRKEKRKSPREETGAIIPASTGRRRRNATESTNESGSVDAPGTRSRHGITIKWIAMDSDIGRYDGSNNAVLLNTDHPFVMGRREAREYTTLFTIAWGLYCYGRCHNEGQQMLLLDKFDFISGWSMLLTEMEESNGRT